MLFYSACVQGFTNACKKNATLSNLPLHEGFCTRSLTPLLKELVNLLLSCCFSVNLCVRITCADFVNLYTYAPANTLGNVLIIC